MRLDELLHSAHTSILRGSDTPITSITEDSRAVTPGALFIARHGLTHDAARFIPDAIRAGAAAILTDPRAVASVPPSTPLAVSPDLPLALAVAAETFYAHPAPKLSIAAVTGTNGKTTTSFLLKHILSYSRTTGLITTVLIDTHSAKHKAVMTTPSAIDISRYLAEMVHAGCASAVIETSSHALHQKRVAAIPIRAAIFTNLTGDHLDYHKSMDEYAAAKAVLFESLDKHASAIVNMDDPWSLRMIQDCPAHIYACSLGAPLDRSASWSFCHAQFLSPPSVAPLVGLTGPWGVIDTTLPLVGAHNLMNALQAAAAAFSLGASPSDIQRALASAPAPPGRLEPVRRRADHPEPISVFVDYAHTDDALIRALSALRPLVPQGASLRVVFGCGGDRDRTKRPRMAAAAEQHADHIVVTSDNPRTEDPQAIIDMVLQGFSPLARARVLTDPDRERAIRAVVASANEGDIVLIAGKGHEDYQILPDGHGGTTRRHFDDRLVALDALHSRFSHTHAARTARA